MIEMKHLQVDGDDERWSGDHSKGLVIGRSLAVLSHGLQEGAVRDEEDHEGREDAVEQADEEVLVVEQRSLLPREIQLRETQTQFVVHILQEQRCQFGFDGDFSTGYSW